MSRQSQVLQCPFDLPRVLEVERLAFPIQKQWDFSDFQEALKELFLICDDGAISGFLVA